MNIEADLKWIQNELRSVDDPAFIAVIKSMLTYRKKLVQSQRISLEQYNEEIDQAIQDIENGDYYTQEEVEKIASDW